MIFLYIIACQQSQKDFSFGIDPTDTATTPDATDDPPQDPTVEDTAEPGQPEEPPEPIDVGSLGELRFAMHPGNGSDGFGFRVAGIQDSNGDSLSELALSAPTYVVPDYNSPSGAVAIYNGREETDDLDAESMQALLISAGPNEYFGHSIASCDFNQDGTTELFVSAPAHRVGEEPMGALYRYSLPLQGNVSTSQAVQTIIGPANGSSFGSAIACDESSGLMAVSAAYFESSLGLTQAGAAWIYEPASAAGSIESFSIAQFYGDREGQNFGVGMSFGDVNGDSIPDILIGGGGEGLGGTGSSAVGGFYGPLNDSYFLEDADVVYRESMEIDHLGNTLTCGHDIDGDGYEDCAISAYWDSSHAERGGAVYLMLGSSEGLTSLQGASARIYGLTDYGYTGISVSFIDDLNHDGKVDLAIGAYGDKIDAASPEAPGAVHIFTHTPQGISLVSDADLTLYGNGGGFGYHVTGLSDADGDTTSDLLVGAYMEGGGAGYLFSGGE
ncbi:MAG: integrin alpha [Myxococcota bacterium]|nr:integrin alpha [Myxococcota bacterium]